MRSDRTRDMSRCRCVWRYLSTSACISAPRRTCGLRQARRTIWDPISGGKPWVRRRLPRGEGGASERRGRAGRPPPQLGAAAEHSPRDRRRGWARHPARRRRARSSDRD
eukprot:2900147-Pyramimonas_sp.AAC.1